MCLIDTEDLEFTVPNVMATIVHITNWKDLGRRLGQKSATIDKIDDSDSVDEAKFKLISQWIKNDRDASWEKLLSALDLEFTIPNIMSFLVDVTNWKDLGLQLGLKPAQINDCEGEEPKLKMITQWMKIDPDANWEKLQTALESPAMCENRVSKGIAKRRGSSFDKRSVRARSSSAASSGLQGVLALAELLYTLCSIL